MPICLVKTKSGEGWLYNQTIISPPIPRPNVKKVLLCVKFLEKCVILDRLVGTVGT